MELYEAMRHTPSCRSSRPDEPLGVPQGRALAALVAVGWPVQERQYRKLSRRPVEEFTSLDHWGNRWTPGPR